MARKKKESDEGGGVPEWLVTFADLMSLLVCFFVLIISFSIQDKEKLQVVAGSIKDAFGIKKISRKAGMIEIEGAPVREYVKKIAAQPQEMDSDFAVESHDQKNKQGPEANTHEYKEADIEKPRNFALAAASLRQAWQELPEITEVSTNIIVQETPEGLNIELVDQDGRSMFKRGSINPYRHTHTIIAAMAPVVAKMPNRIRIIGHTDSTNFFNPDGFGLWELSAGRANSIRRILEENGVNHEQVHSVVGKADTDPMFPDDKFIAANRRVTITLMSEAPPFPVDNKM